MRTALRILAVATLFLATLMVAFNLGKEGVMAALTVAPIFFIISFFFPKKESQDTPKTFWTSIFYLMGASAYIGAYLHSGPVSLEGHIYCWAWMILATAMVAETENRKHHWTEIGSY